MSQHSLPKKLFWQMPVLIGILILVITVASQGVRSGTASEKDTAYPAPGASSFMLGVQSETSACDKLYAQSQNLPPGKEKLMNEQEYQSCLSALALTNGNKRDKPTDIPLPTSDVKEMRPRRAAGSGVIIFGVPSRISPTVFFQTNTWYEKKVDTYIYVFAGANRASGNPEDLSEGAIFVDVLSANREIIPGGGVYPTPVKAGPVTIVDANGEQLTLSTQDGHVFFFNLASRKYINPPGLQNNIPAKRGIGNGFIVEDGRSPFSVQFYKFENQWFKDNNGKRITVFIGKENGANGRGAVMVVESLGEPTSSDNAQVFFTTSQSSALRVFDIKNNQLILVNVRGEAYTFDLDTYLLSGPILLYTPDDSRLATLEAPIQINPAPTVTKMPEPVATLTPPQPYP